MNAMPPALLALQDGTIFRGRSIGVHGQAVGEVVFNTSMTGYQEILTDPSYARQIVTLTYPHIGNTGTNQADFESDRVWSEGLVIRDLPIRSSSWREEETLPEFLRRQGVVAIADIDTRKLTRHIREHGAMGGCIRAGDDTSAAQAVESAKAFPGLSGMDLAKVVTRSDSTLWQDGSWYSKRGEEGFRPQTERKFQVVAYDFGVKRNILRLLVDRHCALTVVPATTTAQEALEYEPDGIFLSNGPGDPDPCTYAIEAIQAFLHIGIPVFGICLGCQLLGLASGARTVKMPYGHHGANHPVFDLDSETVIITSQNHGFAVDRETLPNNLRATHISLFDRTLQGIHRTDVPAFGFQGHPEASPGPQDCQFLFDHFVELMREHKEAKHA
ncbi:MAG: glutamine-hydrolyzing carbamoyl-phosphate synthase small subunit [Gammaproteobacteria bacterium]|nr:glutamine-hydrolyzing carbamoyl-phosphate synthase small subunit [Gammaproteobacteria bacterium]